MRKLFFFIHIIIKKLQARKEAQTMDKKWIETRQKIDRNQIENGQKLHRKWIKKGLKMDRKWIEIRQIEKGLKID